LIHPITESTDDKRERLLFTDELPLTFVYHHPSRHGRLLALNAGRDKTLAIIPGRTDAGMVGNLSLTSMPIRRNVSEGLELPLTVSWS